MRERKQDLDVLSSMDDLIRKSNPDSPSVWPHRVHSALIILKTKKATFEDAIDAAFSEVPYSVMSRTLGYCKRSNILSLLKEDISEVPVYLSSKDPDIKVLTEWRLFIGR